MIDIFTFDHEDYLQIQRTSIKCRRAALYFGNNILISLAFQLDLISITDTKNSDKFNSLKLNFNRLFG